MAIVDTTSRNGMQRTQIAPLETILPVSRFWSTYMMQGQGEQLATAYVEWDYITEAFPEADFVGEGLTVPPTERGTFKTAQVETPIYQHRKVIGPKDLKHRLIGEPYGAMPANMFSTLQQRAAKLELKDDVECVEAIANKRERMVVDFLFNGLIDVLGYGVNRQINYEHPNKIVLLGGDQWGNVGVDHMADLRGWMDHLEDLGTQAGEMIIAPEVWPIFENDEKWMSQLDNLRTEKGKFAPEKAAEYGAPSYRGTLRDPFLDIYVQRSKFYDKTTKTMRRLIPENTIILISEQAKKNRFVYGAMDYMENGQYQTVAAEYVKEMFHDDRSMTREVLVTSRAMPIPENLNSWLVATVK